MAREHELAAERLHRAWDNSLEPVLSVASGDVVTVHTIDSAGNYYKPGATAEDARRKPVFAGHPLTGPIYVEGARPSDVLQVDVLAVRPGAVGYTAVYPGRALLGEDFTDHHVVMWDLADSDCAAFPPDSGIRIPLEPFCGVMGVAPVEPGQHNTLPPRRVGGNMDIKQLTAGSTLYLPVEVEGALFSCGDAHAAQGDGEVCITAIECDAVSTFRFTVRRDLPWLKEPHLRTAGPVAPRTNVGPYHATTAHAPDLMQATKQAIRYLIDWLEAVRGLSRADAYVLCSVAADLKISQVVDAPNWTVSAFLPLSIFDQPPGL